MLESRQDPIAPRHVFAWRLLKFLLGAQLLAGFALGLGVLGYHYIAGFTWVDSLLNASMILGGMGPMGELPSDTAKVFASAYALFSGLVFITVTGIVLAPRGASCAASFPSRQRRYRPLMSTLKTEHVVILGASDKPDRYSHKAQLLLGEHGHEVVPLHPKLATIEGVSVVADLSLIVGAVDTVTMYVGAAISSGLADKLISLKPPRVIFNPGSENPALSAKLEAADIAVEEACTLVLLRTGQF